MATEGLIMITAAFIPWLIAAHEGGLVGAISGLIFFGPAVPFFFWRKS